MNQTMTKLYSTPSKQTDFEKIKSAAKVAEKTVGKYTLRRKNIGPLTR